MFQGHTQHDLLMKQFIFIKTRTVFV